MAGMTGAVAAKVDCSIHLADGSAGFGRGDHTVASRLDVNAPGEGEGMAEKTEAYCVKCREKREIQNPEDVTMKNGRSAIQGTCGVCGTKLFRMVSNKDKAKDA